MHLSIIFLPLLSSIIAGCCGCWVGRTGARIVTVFGMLVNLSYVFVLLWNFFNEGEMWNLYCTLGTWMSSELMNVTWSFTCDGITLTMFFVVNLISTLVHIYSSSYMSEDPHLPRFMSYLSLFTFFMLVLITAASLPSLFLGWEGVGVCSFLLIGFWFTRIQATKAALKALIVNRVSDVALTLGMITCFCTFRDLNFSVIFSLTPFFLEQSFGLPKIEVSVLTTITILFLLGAMGKSAQIFLHTWLPDAMEGPTPVSALIHAATMVTAGVFLIIKSSALFEYAPTSLLILSLVGGLTAFFSSLIGLIQYDMKKIIAYSTCSQLGYMMFASGLSAYHVSLFHLTNHAIFKALLFLSAGSIIHSVGNEQDLRRMGGLTKLLPVAYISLTVGSLALIGFPFMTGYYSKDVILEIAYSQYNLHGSFVHWLGTITAFFTSFYSFRLAYLSFLRPTRLHKPVADQIHESPLAMTLPLVLLAIGSIFFGYMTKDIFVGLGTPWFDHVFLILPGRNALLLAEFLPFTIKNLPFFFSIFSLFLITFWYRAVRKNNFYYTPYFQKWHRFLSFKWYFDLVYNFYINQPIFKFGHQTTFSYLDLTLFAIFGPKSLYSSLVTASDQYRQSLSGRVYTYAGIILVTFFVYALYSTYLDWDYKILSLPRIVS